MCNTDKSAECNNSIDTGKMAKSVMLSDREDFAEAVCEIRQTVSNVLSYPVSAEIHALAKQKNNMGEAMSAADVGNARVDNKASDEASEHIMYGWRSFDGEYNTVPRVV